MGYVFPGTTENKDIDLNWCMNIFCGYPIKLSTQKSGKNVQLSVYPWKEFEFLLSLLLPKSEVSN